MKGPLGERQGGDKRSWMAGVLACLILGFITAVALAPVSIASDGNDVTTAQDAAEDNLTRTYEIKLMGYPTLTRITLVGENVQVEIEEIQKPVEVADPPLLVRAYFSLEATGSVENAKIQFRVPRSWLQQNSVVENSIKLLRLNSEWQELPTRLVETTDLYIYYEATTPGFSVFAVAGQSTAALAPLGIYAVLSIVAVAGGFSAFYWFRTRPMKPFVSLARLKHKVMGRKPGRAEMEGAEIATTIRRLKHVTKLRPAEEPSIRPLERPIKPKVSKSAKEDVMLLKRLKRKMEREE